MKTRGKFIVIDGTDGSGKATQTELFLQRLIAAGVETEKIDFPRYSDNFFGSFIAECLGKKPDSLDLGTLGNFLALDPRIASSMYALDRLESAPYIESLLEKGITVIADRYASSNALHQGAKISDPEKRRVFLGWLDKMEFEVLKIPRPDTIVYLHVPVEISMELARKRAEEKGEKPDMAEIDARHQHDTQKSASSIVAENNNWIQIDCSCDGKMLSREEIALKVWDKAKGIFNL